MSGNILDVLSKPAAADPDFYNKGLQNLNALRDTQAKQAAADAYRQAIKPDGTMDVPKYNALIASGPGAWNAGPLMEQQGRAAGAQANAGSAQADQAQKVYNFVAAPSASLMNDPSDANLANIRQQLVTAGAPPGAIAELDRMKTLSEADRRTVAYQHNLSAAEAQHRLAAGGFATPVVTQFGGTSAPVAITPATPYGPSTMTVGGGVPHAPSPETYYAPQNTTIWYDANNQVTTDPSKVARTETRDVPRGPAMGAPPPGSVGGPQGGGPGAPQLGLPPGAPPPLPGQRLVGGRFVTPPVAPAPNAASTPPPVPSQPPPGAAPPPVTSPTLRGPGSPATPPATATPAPPPVVAPRPVMPGVVTSSPQGQPELLAKDNEVRTQANLAMPDQQKRLIAGQSALDALKLADTGPATGFVARVNAFFKAQGITPVPQGQLSDTDYRQLLQKNLLRFAQSSGRTGGTDLGLETQIHSNANVDDMLAGANRHVLIQDLGILKRDITQTQEMPTSGPAGSVVKHVGEFSTKTAPEAFMWDTYTPPERAEIEAKYAKDGKTQQLHDSLELAVRRGAIPDPRKAAQAARPAVVAPPQPATNPLVPTN